MNMFIQLKESQQMPKENGKSFYLQAENDAKVNAGFSAAKHCSMELLLQKCIKKKTHESMTDMGQKQVSVIDTLVRNASESNEHHDAEITSARATAEEDVSKNSDDIINHMEEEQEAVSGVFETTKAQARILDKLRKDHSTQSGAIEQKARDTFHQKYMDYEPSGNTPVRCDIDVPS
ncbi:hypothetical protein L2E82_12475 [Cichorium intybus]|uniref:Uncharacterized protein n=1 Tax=Cichorium intybus TaxID=13427 RepID=A0ACB9GGX6_CICIN|nr:hypothetical protein L2E82_12475 [Cichorium intybus]